MGQLEQLTTTPATLGEGPCWHAGEGVLYWVDIWGKKLHRFDPDSGIDDHWELGQMIGTVAPRSRGGLILGLENGFAFFDPCTEDLEFLPETESREDTRFNDGKCDPQGRFWCGSMEKAEENAVGSFYRFDTQHQVTKIESNVFISNGMGWNPEQTRMYYIDSPTKTISVYDYHAESGNVTNRRPLIELDEDEGYPDGMTTDKEGKIWLAHWAGGRVCRWDPESGSVLERHDIPAPHTSACCFGGKDMRDLYITTARKGLTEEQLAKFPASGCLFRLRTNVEGSPTYSFGG